MHDRRVRPPNQQNRVVLVARDWHGEWHVLLPDDTTCVICDTLEEARRLAYLQAARTLACELIIRDAYHRVVDHEVIDWANAPAPSGAAS